MPTIKEHWLITAARKMDVGPRASINPHERLHLQLTGALRACAGARPSTLAEYRTTLALYRDYVAAHEHAEAILDERLAALAAAHYAPIDPSQRAPQPEPEPEPAESSSALPASVQERGRDAAATTTTLPPPAPAQGAQHVRGCRFLGGEGAECPACAERVVRLYLPGRAEEPVRIVKHRASRWNCTCGALNDAADDWCEACTGTRENCEELPPLTPAELAIA